MNLTRRGFLAGILAAGVAPAVVKAANLMPVVKRLDSGLLVESFDDATMGERYSVGWEDLRGVFGASLPDAMAARFAQEMLRTKERVAFDCFTRLFVPIP